MKYKYDVFISHATEDKKKFVNPLVSALKDANVKVWYDDDRLVVGDSIFQSIQKGLSLSRYGLVILSPVFFKKIWTWNELGGLLQEEKNIKKLKILPVMLNIAHNEIKKKSSMLADRKAIYTDGNVDIVVEAVLDRLGLTRIKLPKDIAKKTFGINAEFLPRLISLGLLL